MSIKKARGRQAQITQSELSAAMDNAMSEVRRATLGGDVLSARPPGFFTIREYAEKHKLSAQTANQQLRRLVEKGLLVQLRANGCRSGDGRRLAQIVFGLAKKA